MSYLSIGFVLGGVVLLVAALTSFKDDFINEESVARE